MYQTAAVSIGNSLEGMQLTRRSGRSSIRQAAILKLLMSCSCDWLLQFGSSISNLVRRGREFHFETSWEGFMCLKQG